MNALRLLKNRSLTKYERSLEELRKYEILDKGIVAGMVMDLRGKLCRVIEVDDNNMVEISKPDMYGVLKVYKVDPSCLERVIYFNSSTFSMDE